jgi:hypothetical protein
MQSVTVGQGTLGVKLRLRAVGASLIHHRLDSCKVDAKMHKMELNIETLADLTAHD